MPDRSSTFLSPDRPLLDVFGGPGQSRGPLAARPRGPGGVPGAPNLQNFRKFFFLQNTLKWSPKCLAPSKPQNITRRPPQWLPFRAILGANWVILGPKNAFFSRNFFLLKITFLDVPKGLEAKKKPKNDPPDHPQNYSAPLQTLVWTKNLPKNSPRGPRYGHFTVRRSHSPRVGRG